MEKFYEKTFGQIFRLTVATSLETIFFHPSLIISSTEILGPIFTVGIRVLVVAEGRILASTFCTVGVIDITTTITW